MNKKINIVPLKNLNLSNRFLFDEVMEDVQTHQNALEIIFGKEISLLDKPQTEKEFRISPLIRSVRMDVFAMDKEQSVYNTEMQDQKKKDLAKRSRYYQSMIDTSLLEPGIPNYNLLSQSFIIIITTFDLFGFGKYVYTFEPRCREVPECALADGATRIFLNTKCKNDDEISEELAEFLHYIENSTDAAADHIKSAKVKAIHDRVRKVRANEEIGVRYMQAWEEKYYEREEGRNEGEQIRLIRQVCKKIAKGKAKAVIAEELEEELHVIERICTAISECEDSSNCDVIYDKLMENSFSDT